MMKYWRVTSFTPYCGEERDDYIATNDEKELHEFAEECAAENGLEWYDEQVDMDEEEYYDQCTYEIEEIDYNTWSREVRVW